MSLFVDIEKTLGAFHLQVRLEAGDETLALLGASGCGKSLTLKCIAGMERPDRGRIVVDGETLFDSEKGIDLSPQKRRTGLLFQNYALFPNMTVAQNIRAGARRDPDRQKRRQRAWDMVETLDLTELAGLYPHQLSGGQQQRAALGRLLVSEPRILLLDEPFSALDSHLRFRLEREMRQVIGRFGKTVLLVSHDRDEVFRMADSIAIMDRGAIEVCGEKAAVFADPRTRSGAVLTGCKNISRLEPLEGGVVRATDWGIDLKLKKPLGGARHLGIRMHDIRPGPGENTVRCRVVEEIENPFSMTVMLEPVGVVCMSPLGWELDKALWRSLRREVVEIHLPPEAILTLTD